MSAKSNSLTKFEILLLYKNNILLFFDSLISLIPDEPDLIVIRILLESQIPIEESMKTFSERIIPFGEMIKSRNDKFLYEENDLFGGLKQDKVVKWTNIWRSQNLDKNDREEIFKWFDLFLGLAEMYVDCNH